jgi:hypothetical protein
MSDRITGFGMWVAFHAAAHKNQSWFYLLDEMRQRGVKWCALRVGEHDKWHMKSGGPFGYREFILACERNDIRPVSWAYCYPRDSKKQATFIKEVVDAGFRNHIINAEIEWTGKKQEALSLVAELTNYGQPFMDKLAHAPLSWLQYHPQWPYNEFSILGDTHPQLYWTELLRGNYNDMAEVPGNPWDKWDERKRRLEEYEISPIGCSYGKESVFAQKAPGFFYKEDLAKFMERAQKYAAYSLYSWEAASPVCLEWLKNWHEENMRKDAALFEDKENQTSGGRSKSE